MVWQAGRDSQARPGGGDMFKEAVPGGFNPTYVGGDELSEQDYRSPGEKGGPGRGAVTAPPSTQMQPEDKARGGYPSGPGHSMASPGMAAPGHGK
jgi:hypothetical protein